MPSDAPRADGPWVGTCPAGHRTTAHRRPVRVTACRACSRTFDVSAVYTWSHSGRPAVMDSRYEAELARILTNGRAATKPAPVPVQVGERVRLTGTGKYAPPTRGR